MSPRIRFMALAAAAALAGCSDRSSPALPVESSPEPAAGRFAGSMHSAAARERLARRLALALGDPALRAELRLELERSPVPEGKLHFQRLLGRSDRRLARALARAGGDPEAGVDADARQAPALELYLPVPAHRASWRGDDRLLVATAAKDHEVPVAFTTRGRRLRLDPARPPDTPVLAMVPVETDFDRVEPAQPLIVDGGGPPQSPPPGLYMTFAHFVETFEGWMKGAPEFEVHMLGQAGATDSLTTYSCAGERSSAPYYFNQDKLDWSGNVMLISQAQLNSYKSAHPGQNLRVFVVEDDDTACQIKVDPNRFANVIKAVDGAYSSLTAGRDSTSSSLQRYWKKANAIQKLIKALASLINTDDELVGNAVESSVVGVSYPGANWVIKGETNKTNGWVNLIMR